MKKKDWRWLRQKNKHIRTKYFSQSGEDLMLENLFNEIGVTNCFGVEFGASDGNQLSNLRMFINKGWTGLQIDSESYTGVKQEFVTADNINTIFKKYKVPQVFDILSIDIDGNDYWVWKAINYKPRVVIIEYNSNFSHNESLALKYDPNHVWDKTYAYGASFTAMCKLAKIKDYYLYAEISYTNLIFVHNDIKVKPLFAGVKLPYENHIQKLNGKKFIEV